MGHTAAERFHGHAGRTPHAQPAAIGSIMLRDNAPPHRFLKTRWVRLAGYYCLARFRTQRKPCGGGLYVLQYDDFIRYY